MRENGSLDNFHLHRKVQLNVGGEFPRFLDKDVDDNCLAGVIEVAHPPSPGWNLQALRWIVIRGNSARRHLESMTYNQVPVSSAPVILVCLADTLAWKSAPQLLQEMIASRKLTEPEAHDVLRRLREYYSASPEIARRTALANALVAVHQVLLSAAESNLSAYWVTEFDEAKIKTYFHIPDHFLVAALLPVGYGDNTQAPAVSKLATRTFIYKEKFGELPSPTS